MQLLEISLLSDDIDATAKFYNGKLGLPIIRTSDETLVVQIGSTEVQFIQSIDLKPVYHLAFNIPWNQLEVALAWTKEKIDVIPFEGNELVDFPNWDAKTFYFRDNNGNILEMIGRFGLPVESDEPFDEKSIINVSELAVVADQVTNFTEVLTTIYGLPVFGKQPIQPTFSALGDETGLLIITATGRNWFPTETRADKFYARVKLFVHGQEKELVFNKS